MHKGYFFTVEGCEGAGKTSVITSASEYLSSKGYDIVTSREPGGIEIAEQIRSVILDKTNTLMDGRTEALLYAAARRQHLVEKVVPSLLEGKVVICDRFIDSSLAYQGYARGIGIEEVLAINSFAIDNLFPDLTIFLDVDPEIGLKRIHAHEDREINRLDLESLAFHQKVREGYLEVERLFPNRIVKVDASHHKDEVFERVKQVLNQFLESDSKA
ncbi:dTMP kinase [Paenibacillus sp. LMG 31456]|uniref:Thymidylate kinase n=1 Tax=Paenibacillus foliorum TaxID=2654974 RepID=A0A972GWU0_9BACL|nr:dTMP kinase [Paenibacillus foliorum]NOU98344.1 dTMP kinase [Paenibacillus foliorum]